MADSMADFLHGMRGVMELRKGRGVDRIALPFPQGLTATRGNRRRPFFRGRGGEDLIVGFGVFVLEDDGRP